MSNYTNYVLPSTESDERGVRQSFLTAELEDEHWLADNEDWDGKAVGEVKDRAAVGDVKHRETVGEDTGVCVSEVC